MANNVELLKQYKELLDQGILTQEEFEAKRNEVLAQMVSSQEEQKQDAPSQPSSPRATTATAAPTAPAAQTGAPAGESTFLWAVLGFFVPIVGLILYIIWKDEKPAESKSAGKGALIGVIVSVVIGIIYGIIIGVAAGSYYY